MAIQRRQRDGMRKQGLRGIFFLLTFLDVYLFIIRGSSIHSNFQFVTYCNCKGLEGTSVVGRVYLWHVVGIACVKRLVWFLLLRLLYL